MPKQVKGQMIKLQWSTDVRFALQRRVEILNIKLMLIFKSVKTVLAQLAKGE